MPVVGGRRAQPALVVIYGPEGVGKSLFASSAPGAGVVDLHSGTWHLDIPLRFVPELVPRQGGGASLTLRTALAEVRAAASDKRTSTVVVDGLDDLEPLIHAEVVADARKRHPQRSDKPPPTNIEEVGGGFQKGYEVALLWWADFLNLCRDINRSGKNVILTAHARQAKVRNPGGEDYERWALAIQEKAAKLIRQQAEAVLFAHQRVGSEWVYGKRRARMDDQRVMETRRSAGWDAKNRLGLPATMPLLWAEFWRARERYYASGSASLDTDLEEELQEAIARLPEVERKHASGKPLMDYAREHPDEAPAILNWTQARLEALQPDAADGEGDDVDEQDGGQGERMDAPAPALPEPGATTTTKAAQPGASKLRRPAAKQAEVTS